MKSDGSCKKPTLKGMSNTKHLGHFAKDKYIQAGHNTNGQFMISQIAGMQDDFKGASAPSVEDMVDLKSKAKSVGVAPTSDNALEIEDLQRRAKENLSYDGKKY
jgi:hypothetical protein